MAFVTHEQGIERTIERVESERGERMSHLQLLVAARLLAAEVRRLREENARLRAVGRDAVETARLLGVQLGPPADAVGVL